MGQNKIAVKLPVRADLSVNDNWRVARVRPRFRESVSVGPAISPKILDLHGHRLVP